MGLVIFVAGDQRPRCVVEIHVETGQYHGAVRQFRDGRKKFGGRRHRSGGTGCDDRRIAVGETLGFGLDQQIAARGRFDRAQLLEALRPEFARNLEKAQRQLPILIEIVRHQPVEFFPVDLARRHVVHEAGEIVGEAERGLWRIGDQRRAMRAAHRGRIRPFQNELREQQPALQRRDRSRQSQCGFSEIAGGGLCKRDLVLVEVADGDDARQDGAAVFHGVQKHVARQPARAPGRQKKGGTSQLKRVVAGRKAGHQFAGAQRLDQRDQKRCRSGNIEDIGASDSHGRIIHAKACGRSTRACADGGLRGGHGLRCSDMHPQSLQPQAV